MGGFMALAPVTSSPAASQAQAAFGLEFESLLKIILTQLTYQDPLKPVDNFQFVSQLGQFAQLQQSQSLNDQIARLISAQAATQATGLIGRKVDVAGQAQPVSGTVSVISLSSGTPLLTVKTDDGQTIGNLSLADVTQIR